MSTMTARLMTLSIEACARAPVPEALAGQNDPAHRDQRHQHDSHPRAGLGLGQCLDGPWHTGTSLAVSLTSCFPLGNPACDSVTLDALNRLHLSGVGVGSPPARPEMEEDFFATKLSVRHCMIATEGGQRFNVTAATNDDVRRLILDGTANSCFFRTASPDGQRKALVQITERCNLHCAHCFVSSTRHGSDMPAALVADVVIPRLQRARVSRVTLTGGEPFVHPEIIDIVAELTATGVSVGVCTNATCISDDQIAALADLPDVHVNVSFDGFRAESHGRFRGDPASFEVTVATTRKLADAGLLQGLLSTPNALTTEDDYIELARFAVETGAEYLLMNPLSSFGRGTKSKKRLAATKDSMTRIRDAVVLASHGLVDVVPIRFPNADKPLAGCIAGDIVYVFTDGAVAVCPYLVFAARTAESRYSDDEFIVGNIFESEIAEALDAYRFHERYAVGTNRTCTSCSLTGSCGKGCPAAVIADGGSIGDRDLETCPLPA
jgi:radical SAM protein with 4Fe4S-binding SPASM domain